MRVVFDTNIYVSAFVFTESRADEAWLGTLRRGWTLVVSPALLVELSRVLRDKFAWEEERILAAGRRIVEVAETVRPDTTSHVVRDEADNRVLECAVDGKAERIVTGDKGLLKLGSFQGIPICKLADFLALLR